MTVSSDVQPLGATCLESDRVIYIYLDEPNRPSETLWYRLTGANQVGRLLLVHRDPIKHGGM